MPSKPWAHWFVMLAAYVHVIFFCDFWWIGSLLKQQSRFASWHSLDFQATLLLHLRAATVFENHRKSLIQHCERNELHIHFEWTKVNLKCQKKSILASFWKPESCGPTVLSDRSVLIGQKLVEISLNNETLFWLFSNTMCLWQFLMPIKLNFSLPLSKLLSWIAEVINHMW